MNIQFSDIRRQYDLLHKEIDNALQKIMVKGNFILGEECAVFEKEFAEYCGTEYCVTCANGTDAIELALRTLGVREGDEVIVPNSTFIADAIAVSAIGAKVVLCDVGEDSLMDTTFQKHITEKTRAVIPVNLFGNLVSRSVFDVARFYGLKIVEDCAQSVGASIKGERKLRGDIGTYSFYPAKNLGCAGDGGAIVTNAELHYVDLIPMRNYGSMVKYYHDSYGKNSRLDTIQAAILSIKLKHIDDWNKNREWAATLYNDLLEDVVEIKLPELIEGSVWHLYVIQSERRNELQQYLKEKNIPVQIHYPVTIGKQHAYHNYNDLSFPVSERLAEQSLSLPIHPFLTIEQIEFICDNIKSFYNGK